MTEISKLKIRLSHVNKNVKEYRMTVTEAKQLMQEIEDLEKIVNKKSAVEIKKPPAPNVRFLDAGGF